MALQTIVAAWMVAVIAREHHELLEQLRLEHMASNRIGHRPNRIEPRAIKRRPKPHDLLTEPREQARENYRPDRSRKPLHDKRQCHSCQERMAPFPSKILVPAPASESRRIPQLRN